MLNSAKPKFWEQGIEGIDNFRGDHLVKLEDGNSQSPWYKTLLLPLW